MRRLASTLLALLVVLGTITAPAVAAPEDAYDEKLSASAEEIETLTGFSVPENAVTYDGKPGYFVTYGDDGDLDSIESWADESDSRDILEYDNDSDRVLLTAEPIEVHGGFGFVTRTIAGREISVPTFGDGLVGKAYVETIDVNQRVRYVEPVSVLHNESEYQKPAPDAAVSGRFDPAGVAFNEDADRENLSSVRSAIGVENVTETGSGQTIAVIDTGANVGDGQIYGNGTEGSSIRISEAKNFISNESVNTSASNPDWSIVGDGNGHGSWVASAAAANATGTDHDGIAPDANLLIAKALDDDGSGNTQDIAEAIDWAEANGADVIVMSLGSPMYSATLADELDENVANGSVTVATIAAGNSRETVRYIASPADSPIDGVVAVAATNTSGNSSDVASAYFSSVGPDHGRDFSRGATVGEGPDVAAPGMNVVAPVLTKSDGIRENSSLSGTSMATPIVAGGYAVVLEKRTEWQNETQIVEWTENTSRRLNHAGTTEVGDGLIAVDRLRDKDEAEKTQSAVRSEDAVARDAANEGFGGNRLISFGTGVSRGVSSFFDS